MKKITMVVLLLTLLCCILTGCGNSYAPVQTLETQTAEPVTEEEYYIPSNQNSYEDDYAIPSFYEEYRDMTSSTPAPIPTSSDPMDVEMGAWTMAFKENYPEGGECIDCRYWKDAQALFLIVQEEEFTDASYGNDKDLVDSWIITLSQFAVTCDESLAKFVSEDVSPVLVVVDGNNQSKILFQSYAGMPMYCYWYESR